MLTMINPRQILFQRLYTMKKRQEIGRGLRIAVNQSGERVHGFDVNTSFEDYAPQINWMPRLAFSFPISDAANFFAHYDILVQRPQERTNATALDYFYFLDPNRTPSNNPNLRPQKTIDYEVGFKIIFFFYFYALIQRQLRGKNYGKVMTSLKIL